MVDKIKDFFYKIFKKEKRVTEEEAKNSRAAAKDRLHIVLMQDRANISIDFLDLMREEILEVAKKYIVVSEKEIDVRLTHSVQEDGTPNTPTLHVNIPILNIRNEMKAKTEEEKRELEKEEIVEEVKEDKKEEKEKKDDEKINIIIDKKENKNNKNNKNNKEDKKEDKKQTEKKKAKTKETKTKEKKN